ncbi:hypothetical protein U1Q18_028046 [Sarracenia purpurea var. burkii]
MEDDDEFGDLYTDVLRPFQLSSALQPPRLQPTQRSPERLIDLNIQSHEVLDVALNSIPQFNFTSSHRSQTLVYKSENAATVPVLARSSDSCRDLNLGGVQKDQEVEKKGYVDPNLMDESGFDFVFEDIDDNDDVLVEKDEVLIDKKENFEKFDTEIEDWNSDSEDDLQIVLSDNHHVPMVNDRSEVVKSGDDDEDGDSLVIVADTKLDYQPMEEREWVDDAAQAMDGKRKESSNVAIVNGGVVAVAPKIGRSNHAYHPYHSQFKVSEVVTAGFRVVSFFGDEILECNPNCNILYLEQYSFPYCGI